MSKKKKIPIPFRNLSTFKQGDEVRHMGIAHRTDDCHFEVIDPKQGIARSLMTGDDFLFNEGYFIKLTDLNKLPDTEDLKNAQKGDVYKNILDGTEYCVVSEDDHTVKLVETESGQLRLHSKIGSEIFYKIDKEDSGPPIDEDGQFLLFELE